MSGSPTPEYPVPTSASLAPPPSNSPPVRLDTASSIAPDTASVTAPIAPSIIPSSLFAFAAVPDAALGYTFAGSENPCPSWKSCSAGSPAIEPNITGVCPVCPSKKQPNTVEPCTRLGVSIIPFIAALVTGLIGTA